MSLIRSTSCRLGAALCAGALVIGCAGVPGTAGSRWEAVYVTGTGHAAVYRDGLPQIPGRYLVNVTEPGKADFLTQSGRVVGRGSFREVGGTEPAVRIDIPASVRVVITGQR